MPPNPPRPVEHARRRVALGRAAAAIAVAVLGALAVAGTSLTRPGSVTAGIGPLPACRYDDILTLPRGYDDWPYTLVDTILRVGKGYVPPDLVSVSQAGLSGTYQVREVMISDLRSLATAARKASAPLGIQSAYRSYANQQTTFQGWVDTSGYAEALRKSARPGHSEHQLGLAIDFKSAAGAAPWTGSDWAQSPAGAWMLKNAWRYGFVLSYPKGAFDTVCYDYEPWHYRYLGRELAGVVHASGLTVREYLWEHFTAVNAAPSAGSSPGASTTPAASPAADATTAPSPSPSTPSQAPTAEPTSGDAPSPVPSPSASPPDGAGTTAGTWFGQSPAIVGLAAIALLVLLVGALRLARRRA